MTPEPILHELPPSPNNVKVRMALGFKGIAYTRAPIPMTAPRGDRSGVLALSGQPKTPVLEHDGVVIFDSNGIIRYLEANVRREPRLFSDDYAEMGEIESWELFARTRLGEAIGALFALAGPGDVDPAALAAAQELFDARTAELEERLAKADFLVGGRTTNADLAVAALVNLALLGEGAAELSPILAFFRANLRLGDGRERTRAWVERHVAHDAHQP